MNIEAYNLDSLRKLVRDLQKENKLDCGSTEFTSAIKLIKEMFICHGRICTEPQKSQ